jgi:hypothetical protein
MGNHNATALRIWYGAAGLGGLVFGLLGERRPFGDDLLAHPLFVYVTALAIGLLGLRVVSRRPVPEILPERALIFGCFAGLALFLAGNFIAAHVLR